MYFQCQSNAYLLYKHRDPWLEAGRIKHPEVITGILNQRENKKPRERERDPETVRNHHSHPIEGKSRQQPENQF